MEFPSINNFWDLSQTPSQFSQLGDDDFLTLLQKQYPNTVPDSSINDGVNPQSIQNPPILSGLTPPSDESSPSPPSNNSIDGSRSRRHSTFSPGNDNDEPALKRKATDDAMQEGPSTKNQHTADDPTATKRVPVSRRKSAGSTQDDTRLLKRKEQNRAAQRAFRERKEKHVKDLQDQVADLEAKNKEAQSENSNLRDLLARLQQENVALKQAHFTFSMPKSIDQSLPLASSSTSPSNVQAPFSFFSSPLPPPTPASQSTPKPFNDIDWNSLTTFDPTMLNAMDETPPGSMHVDPSTSPYGQYALPTPNQYKTLANNTYFMSFADTPESTSFNTIDTTTANGNNNANGLDQIPFNFPSPSNSWNTTRNGQSTAEFSQSTGYSDFMQNNSLDELFGGTFLNNQGPFNVMMKAAPTPSPVTHANENGQSSQSSISPSQNSVPSPLSANSLSPPSSASTSSGQNPFSWPMSRRDAESPISASEPGSNVNPGVGEKRCPTREDIAKLIAASGDSPFTSSPFAQPAVRKMSEFSQRGGGANVVSCEGSTFPKTKENPANIEVLKAWRTITSHPQFKDADINELCTEFTKKARCDGTKVVLEPEGVHHIFETFKAKSLAQKQQQQQQPSPGSSN